MNTNTQTQKLNIQKAEYIYNHGYPALVLTIDKKEALISDFKKRFLDLGFVPLGSRQIEVEWENILPRITIPKDNQHTEITLKGFTDDPVIVYLARDFYDAINHLNGKEFKVGEILIPKV